MKFPELIPNEFIERAQKLNPALLCDGMKGMGIPMDGCMSADIAPIDPSYSSLMVGTAVTVKTRDGDNFPIHVATYSGSKGYVMIIDGSGYTDGPYFGDLVMGAAQAVGYEGMVVDGYCRDKLGCIELGFPVFSKGLMPRGVSKKNPGEINTSVSCGGITVNPGDLVVGGADGVAVVPRNLIADVLDKAEEKLRYEVKREKTIAQYMEAKKKGMELPELAPQWVLDILAGKK